MDWTLLQLRALEVKASLTTWAASRGQTFVGTHFEPQRASVRTGSQKIADSSSPLASALRLKIRKVSAIWQTLVGQLAAGAIASG